MQGVDGSQELRQLAAGFVGEWAAGCCGEGEGFVGSMVGRNSRDALVASGEGTIPLSPLPQGPSRGIAGHLSPLQSFESLPVFL
jgi:hypothetical protein